VESETENKQRLINGHSQFDMDTYTYVENSLCSETVHLDGSIYG